MDDFINLTELNEMAKEAQVASNLPSELCAHCMQEPAVVEITFRSEPIKADRYLGEQCATKILEWI